MKKLFVHLLLAALTFLSCYGLFACRTIKKDRNHADSTATRFEQQKRAWESQSMQEVVIETDDLAFIQPGLSLPAILGLTSEVPNTFVWPDTGGLVGKKAPPNRRGFARITIRSTAKAAGTKTQSSAEYKQVSTSARITSKEPGRWSWESIALVIVGVLVIAFILNRSKAE